MCSVHIPLLAVVCQGVSQVYAHKYLPPNMWVRKGRLCGRNSHEVLKVQKLMFRRCQHLVFVLLMFSLQFSKGQLPALHSHVGLSNSNRGQELTQADAAGPALCAGCLYLLAG